MWQRRFRPLVLETFERRRCPAIVIEPIGPLFIYEGDRFELRSSFADSTVDQDYSASVAWGDGSSSAQFELTPPQQRNSRLKIRVDYRFDTSGFFDARKRRVLAAASRDVAGLFADNLAAVRSTAADRFDAVVINPATGTQTTIPGFSVGQNEIVVFAAGRDMGSSTLATSSSGQFVLQGSPEFIARAESRGQPGSPQIDFAPWGGQIGFDTQTQWYDGLDDHVSADAIDLYSVALHELFHVMGFHASVTPFARHIAGTGFGGPNAIAAYDINDLPPLSRDQSHWNDFVRDDGQIPLMTEEFQAGRRRGATPLDIAAMYDVGWIPVGHSNGELIVEHRFLDDGVFHSNVKVIDSRDTGEATVEITVLNVPPKINPILDQTVRLGELFTVDTIFHDPGEVDRHVVQIDWGDGTTSESSLSMGDRKIFERHRFVRSGSYRGEVVVVDDDGGRSSMAFTVNVNPEPSAWNNPVVMWDVNRDGFTSPLDALLVINELNRRRLSDAAGRLPREKPLDAPFLDVTSDTFVTAIDALQVINEINRQTRHANAVAEQADYVEGGLLDGLFDDHGRRLF